MRVRCQLTLLLPERLFITTGIMRLLCGTTIILFNEKLIDDEKRIKLIIVIDEVSDIIIHYNTLITHE